MIQIGHLKNVEAGFKKALDSLPIPARTQLVLSWVKSFFASQNVSDDSSAWEVAAFFATDAKPVEMRGAVLVVILLT